MKPKHKIFYENKKLKNYIRRYAGDDWKDFYQDMYFIIDKLDDTLIDHLISVNQIEHFYVRIIFNQLISKKSAFYKDYRKHKAKFETDFGIVDIEQDHYNFEKDFEIETKLKAFKEVKETPTEIKDWYNATICERVAEFGSLRKASKALDIKFRTLHYAIQCTREKLNEKLKSI